MWKSVSFGILLTLVLLLDLMPLSSEAGTADQAGASQSLSQALNQSLLSLVADRTNAQINWFYGTVFSSNRRCWVTGVQFSGWAPSVPPSMQERNIVLLTAKHGITCNHAFGSGPGTQVIMLGTNGLHYTNRIATTIGGLDDLRLVAFTNDWPTEVTPWQVLPTNYVNYANSTDLKPVWYRQNTCKMNAYANFQLAGLEARVANPNPGIPFYEPMATGGDSGSPVFFVLNNRPVFAFAVYAATIQGPFVSNPVCFDWISTNIYPYHLSAVDVERYPRIH